MQLLLKKSRNGDSVDTFHNLCNNKGPTLIFIESIEGFIFGGYTPLDWDNNSNWKNDKETFLFSLTNNKIYKKILNNKYSILCDKNYGPWFAFVGIEKSLSNGKYYIRTKKEEFPFEDYSSIIPNEGKDKSFIVKEVEVYKITFK